MLSDGSDLTWAGNAFQALDAATGKARSPSVENLVGFESGEYNFMRKGSEKKIRTRYLLLT